MSRVGLKPIPVPEGVTVTINRNQVTAEGPNGKLSRSIHPDISVTLQDSNVVLARPTDNRLHRSLHGLTRSLVANMVEGVTKRFERALELTGVGYRAQKPGDKLVLQVGYSHPVEFSPLPGVEIAVEGTNRIRVIGIDKEAVGETAARIRAIRPADSYKGKGIRYVGERVRLKAGKAGKAAVKG